MPLPSDRRLTDLCRVDVQISVRRHGRSHFPGLYPIPLLKCPTALPIRRVEQLRQSSRGRRRRRYSNLPPAPVPELAYRAEDSDSGRRSCLPLRSKRRQRPALRSDSMGCMHSYLFQPAKRKRPRTPSIQCLRAGSHPSQPRSHNTVAAYTITLGSCAESDSGVAASQCMLGAHSPGMARHALSSRFCGYHTRLAPPPSTPTRTLRAVKRSSRAPSIGGHCVTMCTLTACS
ncbi:hypothetical protein C2E23DRAFT_21868 [Lenzites betulinus]|nr:hypothetical protein C2E23DRAFT_21868 [Lenzites betulinus]